MSVEPTPRHRGLTQAPVKPLDADGVQVGVVGTIVWLIAAVVVLLRGDSAPDWWLWTCWVGVGLGVLGLGYSRLRKR